MEGAARGGPGGAGWGPDMGGLPKELTGRRKWAAGPPKQRRQVEEGSVSPIRDIGGRGKKNRTNRYDGESV